jgi:hypothetical protein
MTLLTRPIFRRRLWRTVKVLYLPSALWAQEPFALAGLHGLKVQLDRSSTTWTRLSEGHGSGLRRETATGLDYPLNLSRRNHRTVFDQGPIGWHLQSPSSRRLCVMTPPNSVNPSGAPVKPRADSTCGTPAIPGRTVWNGVKSCSPQACATVACFVSFRQACVTAVSGS